MSVELKEFGTGFFVKDKALKRDPNLKPLALPVNALNKGMAEAIAAGKMAEHYPANIDDYFKAKVWEHREDLPRIAAKPGVFCTEFFQSVAVWNTNTGEPVAAAQPEEDENQNHSDDRQEEEMKSVRLLDQHSRAARLALFGPVEQITAAQYGQVVDLINDDDGCFQREMAEAFTKEPRVFALSAERQEEMLAWIRKTMLVSTQWPEIKKQLTKWLDTPADKRPQAAVTEVPEVIRTDSGARLCTGLPTDRNFKHSKESLGNEIAKGMLAREREFNIYNSQPEIFQMAEKIRLSGTNEEFEAWYRIFITTPGGMDFSMAINIAVVKTAPEGIWKDPVKHREYFNRVMTESDHANPDPLIVDIACGRSSSPMPQTIKESASHDETKPPVQDKTELPAVCPGRAAQLDKELNDAFIQRADEQISRELAAGRGEFVPGISDPEDPKWVDGSAQPKIENLGGGVFSVDSLMGNSASNEGKKTEVTEQEDSRPLMGDREIEIAHALNDLLSGRTDIMDQSDVDGVLACTGHLAPHVLPLLIGDITTTEFCLSPDFTDEEIHDVATTILDGWSDDAAVRQKIALDAIVEYRRPELPKPVALDPPVVTAKPRKELEPAHAETVDDVTTGKPVTTLSYRQQLTIAAIHGMCANPVWRGDMDGIPAMIVGLVDEIAGQEEAYARSVY